MVRIGCDADLLVSKKRALKRLGGARGGSVCFWKSEPAGQAPCYWIAVAAAPGGGWP